METIELFCGNKSFSKVAEDRGYFTTTVDSNPKFNPDICMDIMNFSKRVINGQVLKDGIDVLWASPPCETFSMCGHNYYMGYPTNSKCYIGLALVYKTIELIRELKPKYWFIENPRAGLRSVWFMKPLPRYTVTYCQYGFNRMKPTDIWTNLEGWVPKCCKNGDACHEPAPRGSKTGTQGEKSSEIRGIVPYDLINELMDYVELKGDEQGK